MKVKVLIDNREKCAGNCAQESSQASCKALVPEWGLSALVEFNGHQVLLDTGASDNFASNAGAMNVDLSKVDVAVLSHAHFDHSNGMEAFFAANDRATFYLRETAGENCYHTHKFLKFFTYQEYIGIRRGWLKRYSNRIKFVGGQGGPAGNPCGPVEILPGVFLIGHNNDVFSAEDRAAIAARNGLSVKVNGKYRPDSFDHEQSLVFDTAQGLFIMNSCSHGGADNIVKEIQLAFPGKKIYAMLGGFHLYRTSDSQVRAFAERLRELDVQKIYTGHCTGDHAYEILHDVLGDRAEQMYTGMEIEV